MAQKKKQSVWWMWTSLEGRTKPMCFKLASMRHKNQAWIRPTWWISRTTCSRACDSLQRLPARKGFQPAKAPSLQRPPACKGSLMAKTMLCMQRLLTKQLLPKGCEAVGVGLHGVVQEKTLQPKWLKPTCAWPCHSMHTHTNSTQHTQNQSKNYIRIHTLHSLKHMQQHTQQKHKCTEHIKFKLGVHK